MPLHDKIVLYLERAGLYHLVRLNARCFWLDEPLDVAYQLGLPVDGLPVSGCLTDFEKFTEKDKPAWEWFQELFGELPPQNKVKQYTVHFTWFHERFRMLPNDATEEIICSVTSGNQVHIRWLPFVARLDDMGSYSWGLAALAWLYRCMCWVANRNVTNLASHLQLLQSWIFWRFPSLRPREFDTYSFSLASRYTYLNS
ncbi:hypothetical protein Ahy_A07g035464 isoform C [Arachis hypogaea]|uniref:Aminotransferase-like plant mobile domain-containing protein n=1 Tax=Arachis hypogaea TaxID=3818 RepID=A0A445CDY4_ARAHY|nr:hypothetical protein Ahy_A07g035464 isoform C [Arachis hypogaea]